MAIYDTTNGWLTAMLVMDIGTILLFLLPLLIAIGYLSIARLRSDSETKNRSQIKSKNNGETSIDGKIIDTAFHEELLQSGIRQRRRKLPFKHSTSSLNVKKFTSSPIVKKPAGPVKLGRMPFDSPSPPPTPPPPPPTKEEVVERIDTMRKIAREIRDFMIAHQTEESLSLEDMLEVYGI